MSDCELHFSGQEKGKYFGHLCPVCNRMFWSRFREPGKAHRPCSGYADPQTPNLPPLGRRLENFTRSAIEHAKAGFPTCTDEQITERHATCLRCELYLPNAENPEIGHCTHETCGCSITKLEKFVSKLAWADQECPLGKWPKINAP